MAFIHMQFEFIVSFAARLLNGKKMTAEKKGNELSIAQHNSSCTPDLNTPPHTATHSVEHGVFVINVVPLLLNLALPLVLLVAHPPQHIGPHMHALGHARSTAHGGAVFVLISVFLVGRLCPPLVEQWVQAQQEAHVHHQQGDDPDHQDDHHLDGGAVATLIFALAPGTKLLLMASDHVSHPRQHHAVTVTATWWHRLSVHQAVACRPIACCPIYHRGVGAEANTPPVVNLNLSRDGRKEEKWK